MLFVITLLVVFFITPIFMLFVQFHGIFLKSSRGNQFYLGVPVLVNYLLKLTMEIIAQKLHIISHIIMVMLAQTDDTMKTIV